MKSQLTFPSINGILKSIWVGFILLMITTSLAVAFYPKSPEHLTLLTQNQQTYQANCPTLSAIKNSTHATLTSPFTLLNWNIYKQQKKNWQNSLKAWAKNADFITLQEAKLSPELISFSKKNNLFYLQNYAFKHNNSIFGVNTLSKITPFLVCGSAYSEPWILVPKTGLASYYAIKNSEDSLLIINLHGVNFTFSERPLIKQLKPYLALIKTHQGPIIFSGDFNTWSEIRLIAVEQSLIKAGFSEALFDDDQRLHIFGLPLDHIYFRGLKVIKAESLTTDASDHSPQVVMFAIAP
ncbi:endonuclease/exonuclease/phosphatase family protein [Psychromonas hadalis]|uniref:endonuclease/exonuclease/phosphatase family protein n=1 Tax=Psychromonas hadalis TaxID=211669 RepID=UPI0003B7081C|nr:endonuclease/exonuclease/phosphatase family protein [Psychromonas hadalis]